MTSSLRQAPTILDLYRSGTHQRSIAETLRLSMKTVSTVIIRHLDPAERRELVRRNIAAGRTSRARAAREAAALMPVADEPYRMAGAGTRETRVDPGAVEAMSRRLREAELSRLRRTALVCLSCGGTGRVELANGRTGECGCGGGV